MINNFNFNNNTVNKDMVNIMNKLEIQNKDSSRNLMFTLAFYFFFL